MPGDKRCFALSLRRELVLENLALRHNSPVWKARKPRPRLAALDRIFWVALSTL
jgi:hypothetical protein